MRNSVIPKQRNSTLKPLIVDQRKFLIFVNC